MISVRARLEAAADSPGTITFVGAAAGDADVDPVAWARLHEDARAMAAALQARGVAPGSHVAVIGPTSRALVTALQATWLAGAAVVALPLPMRLGSIEEFVEQTRQRIAHADADVVVIDPDLAPFLDPPPSRAAVVCLDDLERRGDAALRRRAGPCRPTTPTASRSSSSRAGRPPTRRA